MRKDTVVVGWDQEEFIADVSHYSHISYEFLYKTTDFEEPASNSFK